MNKLDKNDFTSDLFDVEVQELYSNDNRDRKVLHYKELYSVQGVVSGADLNHSVEMMKSLPQFSR